MRTAIFGILPIFVIALCYPAPTQADARVFFSRLQVHNCDEIGICDWRLSCGLGNQQEREMIANNEANTNESIDIRRTLTQREFPPIIVTCSAFEHDGGIGAEWETIGTSEVVVTTTGSHSMHLASSEGDVTVHFTVEATAATGQPVVVAPVARNLEALPAIIAAVLNGAP